VGALKMPPDPAIKVTVHFGAKKATFDAQPTDTVASVKTRGMQGLNIVIDPNVDYFLEYHGTTVEDESQTLEALANGKPQALQFNLMKVNRGG
jgi:hypothetical protein